MVGGGGRGFIRMSLQEEGMGGGFQRVERRLR